MYVYTNDKRNLMQGKQVNEYDTDDVKAPLPVLKDNDKNLHIRQSMIFMMTTTVPL